MPFRATDINMLAVPEGVFVMGSERDDPEAEGDQWPQRRVWLSAYWIQKTPVTVSQWKTYLADASVSWRMSLAEAELHQNCRELCRHLDNSGYVDLLSALEDIYGSEADDHPVVWVTWNECNQYIDWLNSCERLSDQHTRRRWMLPTEAQWEKAARGVDGQKYPWVTDDIDRDRAAQPLTKWGVPVGQWPQRASPFGLLNVWQNVGEWCQDWFSPSAYEVLGDAPKDPVETREHAFGKVVRGGNVRHTHWPRCAFRSYRNSCERRSFIGMRLARMSGCNEGRSTRW